MNKYTIDILLATYNGEKYIAQQIYSLLAQTYRDWNLYVADDGSTDNTLEIIKSIMSNDDRLNIIEFEKPVKSAAKNFWRLLPYSKAEFTIFCDQDDIWLDCKLTELLNMAKTSFENTRPCLVYCDTYIYDERLKKIMANTLYPIAFNSFEDLIFHNGGYQGSSILFNQALRNVAFTYYPKNMYIHDEVITLIAHCFGSVFHLDKPLMLYRIHESNVIGKLTSENILLKRLKYIILRNTFVIYRPSYISKIEFYKYFQSSLTIEKKEVFDRYFEYCKSGLFKRLVISTSGKPTKFRLYLTYRTLTKRIFNE